MVRCSNSLIVILNFFVFLLSIPILSSGIWLSLHGHTQCERFFDKPMIALGAFLMVVALAGVVGSCCRVTWLLWFYLCVMCLSIIVVFGFTIFAFHVTNKGSGETIPGKAYKEYRLGDYSEWMQKRMNNNHRWKNIRSCLYEGKLCNRLEISGRYHNASEFSKKDLNSLESGCCKPSNDCNFTYISPTVWNKTSETNKNPDCNTWDSDSKKLCYDCTACKAGFIYNLKTSWKMVAVINIIFLVVLFIVFAMSCCAIKNNKKDDSYAQF
ncbi:Tetraspanin-9 [Hirschfeldia incana]|nr:Tetraspanin-9 [Hirschfeldia incana]